MPRLGFPIVPDGLLVDVLVGWNQPATVAALAAGGPIALPVRARGVIDTGTDITAVGTAVLRQLGLAVVRQTTTQTAAGSVSVNLYRVGLGITDFADAGAPELVEPNLLVMELAAAPAGIDVLIGLDVLLGCHFSLDGPGRRFAIDF
ncbi:MAG TPA: aspartyl protease family protein [Gemmataceae bacterium]|jgi:hypothetical protein